MARKPMVTRTFTTTKVTVLVLDTKTCEPSNVTLTVPRTWVNNDKLMKAVKEKIETDTLKAVSIVTKEELNDMYAMTEQQFIDNAQKVDPKTRKLLEQECENDDEEENELEEESVDNE